VTDIVLVLNAGSSSIKFSVFVCPAGGPLARVYGGIIEGLDAQPRFVALDAGGAPIVDEPLKPGPGERQDHATALAALLEWIDGHALGMTAVAAGHRVVHGGGRYLAPVLIEPGVLGVLGELVPLAPLHQPHSLAAIRALAALKPGLPQVACFDTAFHRSQPAVARAFALPHELSLAGIRRYGFHGLSYEYIAEVLPEFASAEAEGRVVVAHLGAGASMCAMRARRSVATTMGFTALEGLPMGTRSGAIDPGVILYLMSERGMSLAAVTDLLYHRSGLLGVSGISSDMRDLLASDSPRAAAAIDLFVYRIGRELGSLAAALGGIDALVFTGGIGEHAAPIRARVCRDAGWLGVGLDEAANLSGGPRISTPGCPVSAWVIPTDEELMIARHTRALALGGGPP